MSGEYLDIAREGKVTVVTINRPQSRNALNAAAHDELAACFDAFDADPEQWVAIITGAGDKAFCAGHDLKQQASGGGLVTPATGFGGLTLREGRVKPVIAAVNGVAMGGGFELALACDVIVAAATAMFALPEPRVGLAALAGGMHRLPREIGLKRAMGLMLTGRRVSAAEGERLGFVNEVATGDVVDAARAWAAEMVACSPMSLRATRAAVTAGLALSPIEATKRQWELPAVRQMLESEDAVEGPAAFVAGRAPQWKGR